MVVEEGSTAEAWAAMPGEEVGTDEHNSSDLGKAIEGCAAYGARAIREESPWIYGKQADACAQGEANNA
jgi:hypothetical protein